MQRGMEAGFDSAISAVHALMEKTGERIELTRLCRKKDRLETRLTGPLKIRVIRDHQYAGKNGGKR